MADASRGKDRALAVAPWFAAAPKRPSARTTRDFLPPLGPRRNPHSGESCSKDSARMPLFAAGLVNTPAIGSWRLVAGATVRNGYASRTGERADGGKAPPAAHSADLARAAGHCPDRRLARL